MVLAAAARLIFPAPGLCLPTEDSFQMDVEPRGKVVEWSRTIVVRSYSDREHRLLWGLLGKCWLEMRARGFQYICSALTPGIITLYRRLGLQVTLLGLPGLHGGDQRIPALIGPPSANARLIRQWRQM